MSNNYCNNGIYFKKSDFGFNKPYTLFTVVKYDSCGFGQGNSFPGS